MGDLERLYITMRYTQSQIREILLLVDLDGFNIPLIAAEHGLPLGIVQCWYDVSQSILGAYRLDEFRPQGFVLAEII